MEIELLDAAKNFTVYLSYTIFKDSPVLARSVNRLVVGLNPEVFSWTLISNAGKLLVLNDGRFGKRNVGDWFVNTEKLPHGLKGLKFTNAA